MPEKTPSKKMNGLPPGSVHFTHQSGDKPCIRSTAAPS
jgi:hypothetical protein